MKRATGREASRLAARQQGVIRRDQALAQGLSVRQIDHRLRTGKWEAVCPGVYRVEGAPKTWHLKLRAVSLWAARDFALSHRTAAALLGFSRYGEGPVEVTLTRRARPPDGVVVYHTTSLSSRHDVVTVAGHRVTSVARTLLDLAAVEPEQNVRAAADQALSRRWTSLDALEALLEREEGRRGSGLLRALVSDYRGGDGPSESELEARVLELFDDVGLPRPERQRTVSAGGRLRRLDFRVPGTPVIIEADGYAAHASAAAFEKDRERNNALAARGFVVLHWTWAALHERPKELTLELQQTLRRCLPAQR